MFYIAVNILLKTVSQDVFAMQMYIHSTLGMNFLCTFRVNRTLCIICVFIRIGNCVLIISVSRAQ